MNKKYLLTMLFSLIVVFSIYPQTWTETDPTDSTMSVEYTVLTKEQFDRLLRQNEARFEFAWLVYEDVLEMQNWRVTSGRKPTFRGFYYLIGRMSSTDSDTQAGLVLMGTTNFLIYGNSETGAMSITFMNTMGALTLGLALQDVVRINSNDYSNKFNQFVSFVNGEW